MVDRKVLPPASVSPWNSLLLVRARPSLAETCSQGTSLSLPACSVHGFPACSDFCLVGWSRMVLHIQVRARHACWIQLCWNPVFFDCQPRVLARGRSWFEHVWPDMPMPKHDPPAWTPPCVPSSAMTRSPSSRGRFTLRGQWGADPPLIHEDDRPPQKRSLEPLKVVFWG